LDGYYYYLSGVKTKEVVKSRRITEGPSVMVGDI